MQNRNSSSLVVPSFLAISGLILITAACVSRGAPSYALKADEEEVIDVDELAERQITSFSAVFAQPKEDSVSYSKVVHQNLDGIPLEQSQTLMDEAKSFVQERSKSNTHVAVLRRCKHDENDIFCIAFKERWNVERSRRKSQGAPLSAKQVLAQLKSKDFVKLEKASSKQIITAAKKLKSAQLLEVSRAATLSPICISETLSLGLAAVLEVGFPQDENVTLSRTLLEQSTKCAKGEALDRANYRLAMLHVWKNDCQQALPLFDAQLKSGEAKYLQSRSTYWRDWCQKKSPSVVAKSTVEPGKEMYKEFPLSFHSLVADEGFNTPAFDLLTSNPDPVIAYRSTTNKTLNSILAAADVFLRIDEKDLAFHLLEGVKPDHISAEPAEVLLYLSIVANRAQFGLLKFQAMTKAFDKNPSIKTPVTMKFYYPNWYYELVEEHKESVNPYLLLALIRQESAFNPKAQSAAGARGLMQLLPGTAKSFGRIKKNDLFIPKKNIQAGVKFFSYLLKRYNGQVHLALAAYNAGPSAVDDWVKRYPTENSVLFMDLVPYRETREYVATILRNWYWYNKLYASESTQQSKLQSPVGEALQVSRSNE